jgi:spore coat polysaccharide biosynthesis protein SpsF (cytidylyltransferase family)
VEITAIKNGMNVIVSKMVDVHMKMINIDARIIIVGVIMMIGIGIGVQRSRGKGMMMIKTGQIITMVIDILKNHPNMNDLVVRMIQKIENIIGEIKNSRIFLFFIKNTKDC